MKLPGQEIAIKQKIPHQGWHRCSSQLFTLQKRTQRLSAKWPFHLCPGHWPPHSSRRCHTFNWSVAHLPLSSRTKCLPQIRADSCRWEDHKKKFTYFDFHHCHKVGGGLRQNGIHPNCVSPNWPKFQLLSVKENGARNCERTQTHFWDLEWKFLRASSVPEMWTGCRMHA